MNWIAAAILGAGIYVQWARWRQKLAALATPGPLEDPAASSSEVARIFDANDHEQMHRLLQRAQDPLLRHKLMTRLVAKAHGTRQNPLMHRMLKDVAQTYVAEFDRIRPKLQERHDAIADRAPVFKSLAIVLEGDGEFDQALIVCRKALALGLEDGTKTGYAGRIQRIERKQKKGNRSAADAAL